MQEIRKQITQQKFLLGKMAGLPILDKRTVKKFERMGFACEEIIRALEVTSAIYEGAKKGDPRMVEIYLRIMGEDTAEKQVQNNNLLDAILSQTKEEIDTHDGPELQQAAEPDADVVEQTDTEEP